MNIAILCPTRKRVSSVERLINSALENASIPELIEFIFYLDNDDLETEDFLKNKNNVSFIKGERIVLSEMWNECSKIAKADIMMHCGDDIIFRTKNWDSLILDSFAKFDDKIIFVHGNDGYWEDKLGTHGFLHKNWVKTVGYFVPPYFSSDFNDTWLTEVSNMISRKVYVPELLTEHMHPAFGKGNWDVTHQERLERHKRDNPESLYNQFYSKRVEDAQKLINFIDNYRS
jgi:hypothetical protein